MGGVAAAPREVRLTEPGGAEEPWRLLTRALGRGRLSGSAVAELISVALFSPVWGSPPKSGSFTCPVWIPVGLPSVRASHLHSRLGKSPFGLFVLLRPLIFTQPLSPGLCFLLTLTTALSLHAHPGPLSWLQSAQPGSPPILPSQNSSPLGYFLLACSAA